MPKRDPLLFGGSASRLDVGFLEGGLADNAVAATRSSLPSAAAAVNGSADATAHPATTPQPDADLVLRWREARRVLTGYLAEHHPDLKLPPSLQADLDRALPSALDSPWVAM